MLDRRAFVKRETPVVLEVGAHTGWYLKHFLKSKELYGLKQYIQTDISEDRLNQNYAEVKDLIPAGVEFVQVCCDEEELIEPNPFGVPERSVDMIISCLTMHWINELETAMVNMRRTLKRDGFILMSMFGGNTLFELRSSFTMATTEAFGGVLPFVSPLVDGAAISSLVTASGFSIPSIDMDRHVLTYESPMQVLEHLQAMGETACHLRRRPLDRTTLVSALAIYEHISQKAKRVPATFEVFHCVAWSPSPDQAKSMDRGSGSVPLSSLASTRRKDLQSAIDKFAQDPSDSVAKNTAEELYFELQQEHLQHMVDVGISDRSALDALKNSRSQAMGKPPLFPSPNEDEK